jgi:glycosyltransferase involved in cell wall biosynthesis
MTHTNPDSHNHDEPAVVVITPTIGSLHLKAAMESVQTQTYRNILHLIVVDGERYKEASDQVVHTFDKQKSRLIVLPFNTGNGIEGLKFNGHRIYAACAYLVNARYVFFLDEDNWYDPDHISSLIGLMEGEGLDWAYSLRKISSEKGGFVTNDDCESLGRWRPYSGFAHLVDTSCYAFRREVLTAVSHVWYHPLGADRAFYKQISSVYGNYKTSSRYTLNYRLHDDRPPYPEFFLTGNEHMRQKYGNVLPWQKEGPQSTLLR